MPEAPELQAAAEFLRPRLIGETVESAEIIKPIVRAVGFDMEADAAGRMFESVERRGKFLIFALSGDRRAVVNCKLTGALQLCPSAQRTQKRTCVRFSLSGGGDLRYVDDRMMGQFYYVSSDALGEVPGLTDQGPDVLDDDLGFDDFRERLKRFSGEIKGILTRGKVISGIGNAYADEILFAARVYPFKRRKALSDDELRRIHECSRLVTLDALESVRERMGGRLDHKARDFLKVHNRKGQPCPRCAKPIAELRANRRITSYCRACQPGMLIGN